jgi:hypothetical protein
MDACDALWVLGKNKGEYCIRTRGNKKYSSQKYGKIMLIPTLFIPPLAESQ